MQRNLIITLIVALLASSAWAAEGQSMFAISRWIMEQQRDFHRQLAGLVQTLSRDQSPAVIGSLLLASFLYGIFHAAGPGHGKAVIASYLLATKAPLRKGIMLSFISATLQGLVAIVLVVTLAQVFELAGRVTDTTRMLELASYAAIGFIGVWMLWRLARGKSSCGHDHSHDDADGTGHHHGSSCNHHHTASHAHAAERPHSHEQDEQKVAQRSIIAMVSAVGIRPCTGAVLVLLFATSTGILQWGVLATLVMSLGTAITVSALALISVLVRDGSMALSPSKWRSRLTKGLAVVAACALIFISVTMIYSDLQVAGRAF